jgi:putative ABC transport system permease protein
MRMRDLAAIAWKALGRNVSRSLLTMLGIIIGVAAVIASMGIGAGAQAAVIRQIESLGANLIVISPGSVTSNGVRLGGGSRASLKLADATAIENAVPEITGVAPISDLNAQVAASGQNWATQIVGSTPAWLSVANWRVAQGRFFGPDDVTRAAKVAILGETTAKTLFPGGSAIGAVITVRNVPFTVIGILAGKGQSGFGRDPDDMVVVPITTYQQRLSGQNRVNNIQVSASSPEAVSGVISSVQRLLRLTHHLAPHASDDFTIRNVSNVTQVRMATAQTQALLLAAIAIVSLVVGGIGIMNIMLVSVTERTREIGLRLAVGASGGDIQTQFLIEALTMSIIGGVIGVGLGCVVAFVIAAWGRWPTVITPFSVALGFISAALTGVIFGFYPARRAASLDPIEALRYE